MFEIDPVLGRDSVALGTLDLCQIRLVNDNRYSWVLLVPEREGLREIHELSVVDRALLIEEISLISTVLEGLREPDKINIGALGNIVSQLHVHVIARFKGDDAWPGPVWGQGKAVGYSDEALALVGTQIMAQVNDARTR